MTTIEIIRPDQAVALSANEPALAYGFGVFETIRVEASTVQFWNAHWERLNASAQCLGMALSAPEESVLSAIRELVLEQDPKGTLTIKLSALRAEGAVRLLVYSRAPLPCPDKLSLLVGDGSEIHAGSLLAGHKTHNYMENRILMDRAAAAGCYDVVRCNSGGFVAEGAISNVFWEKDGKLYTPAEETGLLPGVVRSALIDCLNVDVGLFPLEDMIDSDAVYLTNSSLGIQPVGSLRFENESSVREFGATELWSQINSSYAAAVGRTGIAL